VKQRSLLSSFILLSVMLLFWIFPVSEVQASNNWLAGWTYRKSHIVNSAAGADIGYQITIICHYGSGTDSGSNVYLLSHCQTDFDDVRFTANDGYTLLSYFLESKVDSDNATYSVKVSGNLSVSAQTIYIYYGNPTATSISSADSTFGFYDHFLGSSLNTTKWDQVDQDGEFNWAVHDSVLDVTNSMDETLGSRFGFHHTGFPYQQNFKVTLSNMYFIVTELFPAYDMFDFGVVLTNATSPWSAEISAYWYDPWGGDYALRVANAYPNSWDSGTKYSTDTANITMTKVENNATIYWNDIQVVSANSQETLTSILIVATQACWSPPHGGYYPAHTWIDKIQIQKFVDPEPSHGAWSGEGNVNYHFVFHGLYNEISAELEEGGVNVTAIYQNSSAETFFVNGTMDYWSSPYPIYFRFDCGGDHYREYWVMNNEVGTNIYIYNETLTGYTLNFYDLAGVMDTYPFVEIHRNVQGIDRIIERRKVDVEKKIFCSCIYGQLYTIQIKGGVVSYTYGDLLFSNVYSIPLTLKGIEFPQNVILAYKYNRVYAERYNNYSTIKVSYEDTQGYLANVTVTIYYQNETTAASASYNDTTAFVYTWLMAEYNETYIARVVITHSQYGTMNYNAILYRGGYNVKPWSFPLGTLGNLNTADIIPAFIIGGCFLIVSARNAYVGGILASFMATLMTIWGWISIPAAWLMGALVFSILLAFTYAKRRVWY